MADAAIWAGAAVHALGMRLGQFFLAPGSAFSFGSLGITLAVFVVALTHRRGRDVPMRVVRRVLFPRRLLGTASGRTDALFALAAPTLTFFALGWALVSAETIRAAVQPLLPARNVALLPGWAAATVATIALFVAVEFAYWLDHRLKHAVPLLWHFHKVHHQAESLSLLTNFRVHPVDTLIFANIAAAILGTTQALLAALLGTEPTPLSVGGSNFLVLATAAGLTHLQHSHLWITFGSRWGRWFLGPAHHQIHHSREARHYNRNMGSALAIFDRMAGTFHQPAATREVTRFGVEDGARDAHGWRAALTDPFVAAMRPGESRMRPGASPSSSSAL